MQIKRTISISEIKDIIDEITTLMQVADIDGKNIRPVLKWSYALLSESETGAKGISIEI